MLWRTLGWEADSLVLSEIEQKSPSSSAKNPNSVDELFLEKLIFIRLALRKAENFLSESRIGLSKGFGAQRNQFGFINLVVLVLIIFQFDDFRNQDIPLSLPPV